mmetsp:Transcript_21218/g.63879  ORF Transcript_21218/g.63879 Transcript_21218/m.63879 type:complete len:457 (+) Transcript_21218:327-1697(+)
MEAAAIDTDAPAAPLVPASVVAAAVTEPVQVTAVSCGSSHSLAILSCDLLIAWGRGEDGQLGLGDAEDRLSPTNVAALAGKGISAIACGAEYTLAISEADQRVYSWGWGDFGRLGHADCGDVFLPKPLAALDSQRIVACACGDTHTLCMAADGALWAFGRNSNGQLGNGSTEDGTVPRRVEAMQEHRVVSISCGAEHSVVSTAAGEVFAWGWGRYGNVGDGQRQDRSLPTRALLPDGHHIKAVASGWRHSLALDTQGRVLSWGWGAYGQLGHDCRDDEAAPRLVESLVGRTIANIAGGWRHTLASDEEGKLYSWGWNKFGQLGQGSKQDEVTPRAVEALAGDPVAIVSAGWRHSCCVTRGGAFYSWGRGCSGQLGHGGTSDTDAPQAVVCLGKGCIDATALCDDSAAAAAFVAPADRYAVVPGGRSNRTSGDNGSVPQSPTVGAASGAAIAKRQKL